MFKIAHISDPHVNLQYHPQHLPRLRAALEHALHVKKADHVVISGDLTSDANERDLIACRNLFLELDLLRFDRLTLVIGNHDIFGGPHLAEDLLHFPTRCKLLDYNKESEHFYEVFRDCFSPLGTGEENVYPFSKRLGDIALVGLNSIAKHSTFENPVGSNGRISKKQFAALKQLVHSEPVSSARWRIVILHHHLFREKDLKNSTTHLYEATPRSIIRFLESQSLKLRGKRKLLDVLKSAKTDLILHGHVHFTGSYYRAGIQCLNSAGAVFPVSAKDLAYHLIVDWKGRLETEVVMLPAKSSKNGTRSKTKSKRTL